MEFFEKIITNLDTGGAMLTAIVGRLSGIEDQLSRIAEALENGAEAKGGEDKASRTRATKAEMEAKRAMAKEAIDAAGLVLGNLEKAFNKYIDKWDLRLCDKALAMAAEAAEKADAEAAEKADADAAEMEPAAALAADPVKPHHAACMAAVENYMRTFPTMDEGYQTVVVFLKKRSGVEDFDSLTDSALAELTPVFEKMALDRLAAAAPAPAAAPAELTKDQIKELREKIRALCVSLSKDEQVGPAAPKQLLRDVGQASKLDDVAPELLTALLDAVAAVKAGKAA
jgi:hypothetical protein